ncbi:MAG: MATE family efflux transporter [Acholeplasmatales bacterium]|nr:MATE family efflux transporter [Acholeplasmatales bacterium]
MNKRFWKKVLIIGLPVSIQNLINTTVNMVDTFMIGSLGDDYVSAVGLASKVFFVMNLLIFGIVSGSSVLLSQYYGKRDDENLNKTFGFMMLLSLLGSLLFFILAMAIPDSLMRIFTTSDTLIEIGAPYLRIVSISYIFTAFSMAASAMLRCINKTKAPMLFSSISVLVNVLFNYLFIFGKLGITPLEANGAAVGTIIARVVEFISILLYLLFAKRDVKLNIKEMINIDKETIKKNFRFALPVIINELGWGLGTTLYSVVYGHMSNDVVAAMTIATALEDLVWALLFGVSTACSVIVGNQLGANDLKGAEVTAKKLLIFGLILSALLGGIMLALIEPYIMLYNASDVVMTYIRRVCIAYAILMPARTFNLIMIVGILRSGGDTLFCMIMELSCLWGVGLLSGAIGAFVFNLDVLFVYLLFESEQIIKIIIGFFRYKQKKWVRNIAIKEA